MCRKFQISVSELADHLQGELSLQTCAIIAGFRRACWNSPIMVFVLHSERAAAHSLERSIHLLLNEIAGTPVHGLKEHFDARDRDRSGTSKETRDQLWETAGISARFHQIDKMLDILQVGWDRNCRRRGVFSYGYFLAILGLRMSANHAANHKESEKKKTFLISVLKYNLSLNPWHSAFLGKSQGSAGSVLQLSVWCREMVRILF